MFERFTERARQVVVLAQDEARELRHHHLGTEHILLGLVREEKGLAARVLKSLDITIERACAEVVRVVPPSDQPATGAIPFTPSAKRALEGGLHEALGLGHKHVDTEHILLGLVRGHDDVATGILLALGADPETIRKETIRIIPARIQHGNVVQQPASVNPRVFERFTEPARQVVVLAQEEARSLRHNYIGTEHILLGLLRDAEGTAARVLDSLDITLERVRAQVLRTVGSGDEVIPGQVPFTPRTKKVLELALREAQSLGHNYIGTEHILLGLVREHEGVAARLLLHFDANADKIRNETIRSLSPRSRESANVPVRSPYADPGVLPVDRGWFDGLERFLAALTTEIRRGLQRKPDTGDLLLALGCAAKTPAGQALRELGVDLDELQNTIQSIRAQPPPTDEQRIEQVRQEKEHAVESQQPEIAARLRHQEARLTKAHKQNQEALLKEIRRRLGLPSPPDAPGTTAV